MSFEQDASFFARNGYLQKQALLEPTSCAELIELTKAFLPHDWILDQPLTWNGPVSDSCHSNTLLQRQGRLQYRIEKEVETPLIEGCFGLDSKLGTLAKSLIGAPLGAIKMRGLYPIFPLDQQVAEPLFKEGHIEAHPSNLITVAYLNKVTAGGGGLLVWPGSHWDIYPAMGSKLEHVATTNYRSLYKRWTSREPIELTGQCGDVIFLHHRLLHAPSVNRGPSVRFAVLCDYRRADFKKLCAERPSNDIWEDWPAIRAILPSGTPTKSDFKLSLQSCSPPDWNKREKQDLAFDAAVEPSTKRKGDASILERMRQPGDLWLILSDNPISANDAKLFPRGSDLVSEGTRLYLNRKHLKSISQYDMIAPISNLPDEIEIRVDGLMHKAWLRLLETRMPMSKSANLFSIELAPGHHRVKLPLGWRETCALPIISSLDNSHLSRLLQRFGAKVKEVIAPLS